MSARNTQLAEIARQKDQAGKDREVTERRISAEYGSPLPEVHSMSELMDCVAHDKRLPCGCDAHGLLHQMLSVADE